VTRIDDASCNDAMLFNLCLEGATGPYYSRNGRTERYCTLLHWVGLRRSIDRSIRQSRCFCARLYLVSLTRSIACRRNLFFYKRLMSYYSLYTRNNYAIKLYCYSVINFSPIIAIIICISRLKLSLLERLMLEN